MNLQNISKKMQETGLNFDLTTILQVVSFLSQEIGPIWESNPDYYIFSATAIICECKQIPSVKSPILVTNGIRIQNIMRSLPGLNKQMFLESLCRCLDKIKQPPLWLVSRITQLKLNYRIFIKFTKAFQKLSYLGSMQNQLSKKLMNLVWIIFLRIKLESTDADNLGELLRIIQVLLSILFEGIISNISIGDIYSVWVQNFKQFNIPTMTTETFYHLRFYQIIDQAFQLRYPSTFDLHKVLKNGKVVDRITDDILKYYHSVFRNIDNNKIDQSTFLVFQKALTPQPLRILTQFNPLMARLDFEHENDSMEIENIQTSKNNDKEQLVNHLDPVNPINTIMIHNTQSPFHHQNVTPLTNSLSVRNWLKNCIDSVTQKDYQIFRSIIYKYYGQQSIALQGFIDNLIQRVIKQYSFDCLDKPRRFKHLKQFYLYLIIKIKQYHKDNQLKDIFSKTQFFKTMLCIAIELFNFTTYHQNNYKQYLEMCELDIIEGFKPINWIGKKISDLPMALYIHLFNIEKQILIHQIWENEIGFKIITNLNTHNGQKPYYKADCTVMMRILKQINVRINQLNQYLKLDNKTIQKVQKLVHLIIQQKSCLLLKNKLDQIILCCFNLYLKQIPSFNNFSLYHLFGVYGQISQSYESLKSGLINSDGKQVDIANFYNCDFLKNVDQLLSKQDNNEKLLSTPFRQAKKQRERNDRCCTPIQIKLQQSQLTSQQFNNRMSAIPRNSLQYRKKIVQKIRAQNQEYQSQISPKVKKILAYSMNSK